MMGFVLGIFCGLAAGYWLGRDDEKIAQMYRDVEERHVRLMKKLETALGASDRWIATVAERMDMRGFEDYADKLIQIQFPCICETSPHANTCPAYYQKHAHDVIKSLASLVAEYVKGLEDSDRLLVHAHRRAADTERASARSTSELRRELAFLIAEVRCVRPRKRTGRPCGRCHICKKRRELNEIYFPNGVP